MLYSIHELPSFKSPRGFVVFEGVNGAGKSTLISALMTELQSRSIPSLSTYEPGDTKLGTGIRQLLLERGGKPVNPLSELLLFAADRSQHVEEKIKPALMRNNIVLCDRYTYSSKAFQGYGRQLDLDLIDRINRIATAGLVPDLVILLDIDAAEGLRRSSIRSQADQRGKAARQEIAQQADHFEDEQLDFHERLRSGFLEIAQQAGEPFLVLDASRPAAEVFSDSITALNKLIDALPALKKSTS